jgi:beta-lactamase class A
MISRRFCLLLPLPIVAADSLADTLRSRIADFPGTVSLYAKNLDTGATAGIGESDPVRTASTIKLPILLSVFDAVARGQAKWTDPLTVTAAEKVSGSGIIASEISDGVQLPLRDVANLMMVLSDNTATNLILERFGADSVNAYLDKLGLKSTRSMRKILGASAERRGVSVGG